MLEKDTIKASVLTGCQIDPESDLFVCVEVFHFVRSTSSAEYSIYMRQRLYRWIPLHKKSGK